MPSSRLGVGHRLLLLTLLVILGAGCEPPERKSKSGRYVLSTALEEDNEGRWVRFHVRERGTKIVFVSPTRWAARHNIEYAFDDADRIWFYSSDVGTSVWRRAESGGWEEMEDFAGLPVPELVKSASK